MHWRKPVSHEKRTIVPCVLKKSLVGKSNSLRKHTMKIFQLDLLAVGLGSLFLVNSALATNPIIMDQFTADPTARVFDGQVYLYPSHDIPVPPGSVARTNWFCMEDYHVFS